MPPRVASRMNRVAGRGVEQRGDQPVQRRAVALDLRRERHVAARVEDRRAVLAEAAVDQHRVARPAAPGPELDALADHADAGGVEEELVAGALVHDLGVAGDDLHAGLRRRRGHRAGDGAQRLHLQPLLDDGAAGEVERRRAPHGEVVDRAADRQLADVAAREEQGVDDEGVRGEGQPVSQPRQVRQREPRLVVQRVQRRVVEGRDEDVVDQVPHRRAAAPVRQRHFRHVDGAAPARGGTTRGLRRLAHAASPFVARSCWRRMAPNWW